MKTKETQMYFPDEIVRIARRFIANPSGEVIRMLIGLGFILLSLLLLHLFLKGTFALNDLLNSF